MDWRRVVEIHCPQDGARGSGYLLARGLVLTAAHVVEGSRRAGVDLRLIDADPDGLPGDVGQWLGARVAWVAAGFDAALLVPAPESTAFREVHGTTGFGRLDGRSSIRVDATGFPRALATPSHTDVLHIEAEADPLTGLRAQALHLQVRTSRPADADGWKGMSGSAVFAGNRLVGVLEAVPTALAESALRATPVHLLLEDPDAARLLAEAGLDPTSRPVDAAYVEALPRVGHWDGVRAAYSSAVVSTFCRLDRVGYAVGGLLGGRLPALAAFTAQRFLPEQGGTTVVRSADLVGHQRLVIVGGGGSGKSTVLKQLLARAAASEQPSVPLWVPLVGLPLERPLTAARLVEHLVEQAGSLAGVGDAGRAFFDALLEEGSAVIGFDALDECGSLARGQRVRDFVLDVAAQWPRCRVIVTSRPDAYRDTPLRLPKAPDERQFKRLDVAPFEVGDIAPFLRVAFDEGDALATKILGMTGIEALTQTPLTLTLVALVARTDDGLPATRTELFKRCLDTVCSTWEEAKGESDNGDGLGPEQRLDVLRWLGWEAQRLGLDRLSLAEARAAIMQSPEVASPATARKVLEFLARRSVVLLPDMGAAAAPQLRGVGFTHAQFREYLAGAHLADWFSINAGEAGAAMAPYWLDSRWLDVLRFAIATLEADAGPRDTLLRGVLAATDPFEDLLHRPEFIGARLLARLQEADPEIVSGVAARLQRMILIEPALRDDAAEALLGLRRHAVVVEPIERLALGGDLATAFGTAGTDPNHASSPVFQWRLRAIAAMGTAGRSARALELLAALPLTSLDAEIEAAAVRARVGDVAGAVGRLKALLEASEPHAERSKVVSAIDAIGARHQVNAWLNERVARIETLDVATAMLARARGVLADDAREWSVVFERAAARMGALDPQQDFAPQEISDAVYAAFDLSEQVDIPAARALLVAALTHPALTWYVAPRMRKVIPEQAAASVKAMHDYLLAAATNGSRFAGTLAALCQEPDDALAVPVLLDLLDRLHLEAFASAWQQVVDALLQRGRREDALARLKQAFEATPRPDDPGDSTSWRQAERILMAAERIAPGACYPWLDARYRSSGHPGEDARRVMAAGNSSGLPVVAQGWFASVKADESGRAFLQALTAHERDTWFTDWARQTLSGGVFVDDHDPPDSEEESAEPPTIEEVERRLTRVMAPTRYGSGRLRPPRAEDVVEVLEELAEVAGHEAAARRAEAWAGEALPEDARPDAGAVATLADRLDELTHSALKAPRWIEMAAAAARRLPPSERTPLVTFLKTQV